MLLRGRVDETFLVRATELSEPNHVLCEYYIAVYILHACDNVHTHTLYMCVCVHAHMCMCGVCVCVCVCVCVYLYMDVESNLFVCSCMLYEELLHRSKLCVFHACLKITFLTISKKYAM